MKKKIVWLLVSSLMVVALVLASCGPAEEEEVVVPPEEEEVVVVEEEEEVVVVEEEVVTEEEVAPAAEVPKYGGVLNLGASSSPTALDQCYTATVAFHAYYAERMISKDWTKGPAGTGEFSYLYDFMGLPGTSWQGLIAESFEMPDPNTLVFKIRKGVRFHDKAPTNGREVDANDVVYTMLRLWNRTGECPRAFHASFIPWDKTIISVEATDKWTVVVKTTGFEVGSTYEGIAGITAILPADALEQFGDMNDWENAIGSGPFMMTNYVKDSQATFVRNPDYWMKDPIGPGEGNQLPYLDGIKYIIIPDLSTRMAALRTAKIDRISGVNWEDAKGFKETNPELKYVRVISSGTGIFMRTDKPALPFYDKKVRYALWLAINNQEIADTIYGGEAEVYNWPNAAVPEWKRFQYPFEELPESTQELYGYNPDKAKQLLAEAGYPDGFKTEIVAISTEVDMLSIVKAYWAKIGVDLKIEVKESTVKTIIGWQKTHKEMFISGVWSTYHQYALMDVRTGHYGNNSMVSDPIVDAGQEKSQDAYFDWNARYGVIRDLTPYMLEQAWFVVLPGSYSHTFWQPWVKNYHGESAIQYTTNDWPKYVWMDQDLKEEITGRR